MRLPVPAVTVLAALLSCTGITPPEPPTPLDVPGGTPVLDLTSTPATWTLPPAPDASVAGGEEDTWTLTRFVRASGRIARRHDLRLAVDLPFETGPEAESVPPRDLVVVVDGQALPWLRGRSGAGGGWRIARGQLQFTAERPPQQVVLHYPGIRRLRERLDPHRAGLPPDRYAAHSLTLGPDTREGLLLPPGTMAAWDLTLPAGARLEAAAGMVEDRLPTTEAPASLVVEVVPAGADAPTELTRVQVPATSSEWLDVHADLSSWAGQQVRLQVRSEGASAPGDVPLLAHPHVVGAPQGPPPRRVVWIGLDTTRRDRLGLYGYERPTSPNLDAWAQHATVFDDAVTPAPRTRPSFRSALTGRRPLDAVGSPVLLDLLDDAGFRTAGVVANVHLNRRFGFTAGAERWVLDPPARANHQVDRALGWLQAHQHQDAALFLHIMDPHLPYIPPVEQRKQFVRDPVPELRAGRFNRSRVLGWMQDGSLDERRKQAISDLYDAEVAFTDQELGRLFQGLQALPGRTLVVIHSDHGEELWDHGGFEHNHTLKPELHDAVMLVRTPDQQQGQRTSVPVELADLLPTVLDLLGVTPAPTDGRSLRPLLEGQDLPPVPRDLGHLMYDRERWAVRTQDHTYVLWTGSGREELFHRPTDPYEHDNLIDSADPELLTRLRALLAQVHGAQVGPGWRIPVTLGPQPLVLELPSPARDAGILDPERAREHRANQAWGERPPVTPDDVGTVALSDDRRTLTVTPGPHARGIVWVRFEAPTRASGAARTGQATVELQPEIPLVLPGAPALRVLPGTLILPPPDEAARMRALSGDLDQVDATESAILQHLGYLRDDPDSDSDGPAEP